MTVIFYLNVISPHQMPLAREVAKIVGEANFRYVYLKEGRADREQLGWNSSLLPEWSIPFEGKEK